MKAALKYLVGFLFLPFLSISLIIAVVRFIFILTAVFAWDTGKDFSNQWLKSFHTAINKLKT